MTAPLDAAAVSRMLADRLETLATELVGSPPTSRSRTEARYYPHRGLAVTTCGPRRGLWCHHGAGGVGGDPLDLVRHLRQCGAGDALAWSKAWLGLAGKAPPRAAPRQSYAARMPNRAYDTTEMARRIWRESVPAAGTPVKRYLRSRGLHLPDNAPLRFHPECPREANRLPAMVSLMTSAVTGAASGVHRTFLLPDGSGKAPGRAKMMCGRAGIIRVVPDAEVTLGLGLTEGIETALSVMQHFGWAPVWAAASAGAIAKFPVLVGIETITLFADSDDAGAGLAAARSCAQRWRAAGREATIVRPPPGTDWLDVGDGS